MAPPLHLGNDVVDLADPRRQGKSRDSRFLSRVFAEEEREAILVSPLPEQALWLRWAGKEAAYKTVTKARGPDSPTTFNHARFRVTLFEEDVARREPPPSRVALAAGGGGPWLDHLALPPPAAASERGSGEVVYGDLRIALRVEVAHGAAHALSWLPPAHARSLPPISWNCARPFHQARAPAEELTPGHGPRDSAGPLRPRPADATGADWSERLRPRFSDREWACISHRASAWARLEARHALARDLRVPEEDLEIGCRPGVPGRRVPLVFYRGRLLDLDLTLSHAGRFVAWAALRAP